MMPRDERLKKRTAAPHRNKNDTTNASGDDCVHSFGITKGHQLGTHHLSASARSGGTRNRKRYKGSRSWNQISVQCIKRNARNCASRNRIKKRGDVSPKLKTTFFLLCVVVVVSIVVFTRDVGNTRKLRKQVTRRRPEFKISFSNTNSGHFSKPLFQIDMIESHDYGGLEIGDMTGRQRQISDLDYLSGSDFRDPAQSRDDDGNDTYMAFDDDILRGTTGTMNENPTGKVCHRTSSHRVSFQNCNSIFELEWISNRVKYLK